MPVVRIAASCAAVLALAGCGAEPRPVATTPTSTPTPAGAVRFVVPPLVTFREDGASLAITALLDRPLRHDLGHPAEHVGHPAYLDVPGAGHDFLVGMERNPTRPTCYTESVSLDPESPLLVDGRPVEV